MSRVLVVDDDVLICDVLTEYLRDWTGDKVTCAQSGDAAEAALRTTSFDLALIDVLLPGTSGFHLAEIAAAHGIPVLLASGHPVVARRLEDFGWPCLIKPFSLTLLQSETRRVIAGAQDNLARVRASAARMQRRSRECVKVAQEGLLF